ncbi:MAG: hypothetical protein A3J74_09835 [Elusimicrobia bacterium RIFCSPHIGHO2_02_FULL_57_9]|nr:MAG: hypothetical protein A3J74_09835 [Elusimicrobia bacterium RIFCSPHIGHO2_02_FULL_57_9]
MRIKSEKITTITKKRTAAAAPAAEPEAVLDYPQEGEVIRSSQYTFRIGAPKHAQGVEICINHGPWQPCRQASGFWWYDWSDFKSGEYRVTARISSGKKTGKVGALTPRRFQVDKP